MQFGGTPMEASPSSTGVTSPRPLQSTLAPTSIEDSATPTSYNFDSTKKAKSAASPMFAPLSHLSNHQANGMFQNNGNGQMSNGPAANGNHYVSNNQQQQQVQPQQQQQMNNAGSANGNSANGGSTSQLIYPALHLQPLNDTFAPKQISLSPPGPQNKVKIGRQTNNKTIPQPANGYFDSKVLSRMHAEVWSQDGKVFIKDVKSSNGTFINGSRLSPEGQESDTFELHSDDIVEFGIDIVGEDNKTIIHHKVACRAFLVMTAEEALGLRHDFAALYRGGIAGSTLNHHSVGPGAEGGLRRSKLGSGSGGAFGSANNGNTMMSFDHILHKLQAELQKSRETAGELGNLNTAMSDIGETLGGGLPPMQNPPYQHMVPSSNGEREAANGNVEQSGQESSKATSETLIKALEEQVRETQRSLNLHMERLTGVEARLEEQDGVKMDVNVMRSQVEEARRELTEAVRLRSLASRGIMTKERGFDANGAENEEVRDMDFDDGASMASVDTVVQGREGANLGNGPMGVDEIESDEVVRQLHNGEEESLDDAEALQRFKNHVGPRAPPDGVPVPFGKEDSIEGDLLSSRKNEELSKRLESIESQLERALELGKTLAGQHAEATETVKRLEERVKSLESEQEKKSLSTTIPSPPTESNEILEGAGLAAAGGAVASGSILAILETKWGKWRDAFENDYGFEKASIKEEREEVKRVVKLWDSLNSEIEEVLESDASKEEVIKSAPEVNKVVSNTTISSSAAAKKRRKRRAAAAAAAAAAASSASVRSPSTSNVGLSGSNPSQSSTIDSTSRINRELRALLYTENFNILVREEHLRPDSSLGSNIDREETPTQSDVGSSQGNGEGKGSNSLDIRRRSQSNLTSGSKRKPPGEVVRGGLEGPAALPMLSVAGVVVFGMTAWVLSGGKGFHLGNAASGGM